MTIVAALGAASAISCAQTPAAQPTPSTSAPAEQSDASAEKGRAAKAVDKAVEKVDKAVEKTIDKAKDIAKAAVDILQRVPCLPPKGGKNRMVSLPHIAAKLSQHQPVVIVAFGSSSTQGFGSTAPEFTYPNRLAAQLHRKYPSADITVLNHGKGGEDAPEMMKRLQSSVIDAKPDLVIWQVGTNAVLRDLDPDETASLVEQGIATIQAAGADVVLVDPQYSPRVNEKAENAGKMVKLLSKVAELRKIGIFPRFEIMREWHEGQSMAFDKFVIADGLHMNDWGYACFAQLLGDDIIKSVGQLKVGANTPGTTQATNSKM